MGLILSEVCVGVRGTELDAFVRLIEPSFLLRIKPIISTIFTCLPVYFNVQILPFFVAFLSPYI